MKKFQKLVEDFTCEHCGTKVSGNGYTNHCPKCLWSKDVDINPGDRASNCGGMMEPVGVDSSGGDIIIIHKCQKCGKVRRQKISKYDDMDVVISLSADSDFVFGKR